MKNALLIALFALTTAISAQDQYSNVRVRLRQADTVPRLSEPSHPVCETASNVYYFRVRGNVRGYKRGLQLVLLVRPTIWSGPSIRFFAQCMEPRVRKKGRFTAVGQVGSTNVPGGEWFAGQRVDVVVVAATQRPTPGSSFGQPEELAGFVAKSSLQTVELIAPNAYQIHPPCDGSYLTMEPDGLPSIGATDFGLMVTSPLEDSASYLFLGVPSNVLVPLTASPCFMLLGSTPVTVGVRLIHDGCARFPLAIPPQNALRGSMLGLQSVVLDSSMIWSSGAWLLTPY
jgi:hypothetical protein